MKKREDPHQKHTTANEESMPTITLFVYGTLKCGYCNHDRFCRNAIDIQPAITLGRLYHLPAGYPALEVPPSAILAHGTADPLADATTQARLAAELAPHTAPFPGHAAHGPTNAPDCPPYGDCWPPGDPTPPKRSTGTGWDLIHGELITFPNPPRDLPPIDRLEGFRPGSDSFYLREIVLVMAQRKSQPAWLYVAGQVLDGLRPSAGGSAQRT